MGSRRSGRAGEPAAGESVRASASLDDAPQDPRLPSCPPVGPPVGPPDGPTVRARDLYGSLSTRLGIIQPYAIGCILVRRHEWSKDTFGEHPEYLRDTQGSAEAAQAYLERLPNWEIVSPATLAVINFRYRPDDEPLTEAQLGQLSQHLSRRINESGEAMLTTTVLKGKVVLRMCLINPRTSLITRISDKDDRDAGALCRGGRARDGPLSRHVSGSGRSGGSPQGAPGQRHDAARR